MSNNISKDIAKITTINSPNIDKIFNIIPNIASHYVLKNFNAGKNDTKLDIGIGELVIIVCEDTIKYSFYPSKAFSTCINDTVSNKRDYLEKALEEAFTSRLLDTYKDMI